MHLRRDAPTAKRSGWVREANCEAAARPRAVRFPDEQREELCEAKSQEGAPFSNKIESLVAEGKLTPSQAVRLHALAQLAYEGIMDDLATGDGAATNATPPACSQGGCTDCSVPNASGGPGGDVNEDANCGNCSDCADK